MALKMWRVLFGMSLSLLEIASENPYGCGAKYKNDMNSGRIYSHLNFNNQNYMNDLNCTWTISAPPNKVIILSFGSFAMETSRECEKDSLTIYDGRIHDGRVISKSCGSRKPSKHISGGSDLTLRFISDNSVTDKGFSISFRYADENTFHCGKNYWNSLFRFGYIYSHGGYRRKTSRYGNNLKCTWTVSAPPNKLVYLFHIELSLQSSYKCLSDSLTIHKGSNTSCPVVARLCGRNKNIRLPLMAKSFTFKFMTDASVRKEGFKILYRFFDQRRLTISRQRRP